MKIHLIGLLIGFTIGAVDCALFALMEPVRPADIGTALTFWTMVGWAVHTSADLPSHNIFKAVVVTWLFNIPWAIEFVILHKQQEMLVPIIGLATVFGAAIGLISSLVKRRESRQEALYASKFQ